MNSFFDAMCDNCQQNIGWRGELKDRPACPHCGHKPKFSEAEIHRVNGLMARDRQRIVMESKEDGMRAFMREARIAITTAYEKMAPEGLTAIERMGLIIAEWPFPSIWLGYSVEQSCHCYEMQDHEISKQEGRWVVGPPANNVIHHKVQPL